MQTLTLGQYPGVQSCMAARKHACTRSHICRHIHRQTVRQTPRIRKILFNSLTYSLTALLPTGSIPMQGMIGVMLNVAVSSLGQYVLCMDVPFSDFTTQAKLAKCSTDPNQYIAVGAKQAGSNTLALVAVARAGDAFAQHCDARLANGAYWYNCVGKSFGFAASSSISLGSADSLSDQCAYRLSWHVDQSYGGYRAGCTTDLSSSSSYYKQIYILSDGTQLEYFI
jgi:hypothetical protein